MDSQDESFSLDKKLKNTEDTCPVSQDSLISKLETLYMSSQEQNLSLSESLDFSVPSSTIFSSSSKKEVVKIPPSTIKDNSNNSNPKNFLTKKTILNSFNNQKMTKILQNYLKEASKEEIDFIVNELIGNYRQIIKDKNGNYFCSDLFEIINQEQRIKILKELSSTICDDCVDYFGKYPIQTLIKFSSSEEEYKLLLNSFNDFIKLHFASIDPNGSYVITKIIEHIPEKYKTQFNLLYVKIICFVCTQRYGVVNAKKFIDTIKSESIIKQLIDLVKSNFANISSNQYGNYLIQNIIERWWFTHEADEIKELIKANINNKSSNKYFSYVVNSYLNLEREEEKLNFMKNLKKNENNDNFKINYQKLKAFNNLENKSSYSHNYINNNLKNFPLNNINNNNNSQIPISFNNFINNNNNIINNNQIPFSLNNINNSNNNSISSINNNNIINNNQNPFTLNNFNLNNNINNNNINLLLGSLNKNPIINNAKDKNFINNKNRNNK